MTVKRLLATNGFAGIFQLDNGLFVCTCNEEGSDIECAFSVWAFLKFSYWNTNPTDEDAKAVAEARRRIEAVKTSAEFVGGEELYIHTLEGRQKYLENLRKEHGNTFNGVPLEEAVI